MRLQYTGYPEEVESIQRMTGPMPKKVLRTDEQRQEYNQRCVENYNKIAGIGERVEMRGGVFSLSAEKRDAQSE